jgi:hypothetical protein
MTLYPNVMRKAQAELDAIVGRDRLPTFQDKDSLPYIRAIIKETLRWRPVGPLGERDSCYHWWRYQFLSSCAEEGYRGISITIHQIHGN